jgi:hypothetical protein
MLLQPNAVAQLLRENKTQPAVHVFKASVTCA